MMLGERSAQAFIFIALNLNGLRRLENWFCCDRLVMGINFAQREIVMYFMILLI
jgi:hypothetical protein